MVRDGDHRPVDPDVDLSDPAQRAELRGHPAAVLGVIGAGGALGASARYGLGVAVPAGATGFPWMTFVINIVGCLLIGALMVLVTDVFPARPLLRPFLGVGVLGGFTTFSTYVVEILDRLAAGAVGTALAYLGGTVLAALGATWVGLAVTRAAVQSARRQRAAVVADGAR